MDKDNQEKLNIIMFNMSDYAEWESGIQNRNYHIFKQLALDNKIGKILAVDYLPVKIKRALRNYFQQWHKDFNLAERVSWATKCKKISDKVSVYSSVYPVLSLHKFYKELRKTAKKFFNGEKYLIWSYFPLETGYFRESGAELKIFDAVDNWAELSVYKSRKNLLKKNYHVLDDEADLIFTVSQDLENLFHHKEKVHHVPNGVDFKHYQREYPLLNKDIGTIQKPIIGYVGNMQDRFDTDLIVYLAKNNPDKSFVLVGKVWREKRKEMEEKLKVLPNVYLLGRKSYAEIPMYIQQFDVAIVAHKINNFIKSTDPMKIYEYLACGKPIVSTQESTVKELNEFIAVTDDYQKFSQKINDLLADDRQSLREERMELAKNNSWLKRTEKMLELIEEKL